MNIRPTNLRELPINLEAEQGLLGALLMQSEAIGQVAGILRAEHFHEPLHQCLYEVCLSMAAAGRKPTPITIKDFLPGDMPIGDINLNAYLAKLAADALPGTAEGYAKALLDLAIRRDLIAVGEDIQDIAFNTPAGEPPKRQIETAIERLSILSTVGLRPNQRQSTAGAAAEAMVAEIDRGEALQPPISTGLHDLDKIIGGYRRGNLLILAGRPGMGKSLLAGSSSLNVAEAGKGVLFFSKEMTKDQLVARLLTDLCLQATEPLTYEAVLNRQVAREDHREALREASRRLRTMPLIIDPQPGMTIVEIATRTRRTAESMLRKGITLSLVVIDHLGKIKPAGRERDNRNIELGEMTNAGADLAKDVDACVMMLCQLNRQVESRENKRPQLSDLRECLTASALLTDADTGALVSIRDVRVGSRVLSMDESSQKIVGAVVTHHWPRGSKPVFKMTLRSGRTIEGTAEHPIFTADGFRPLSELVVGDDVAIGIEGAVRREPETRALSPDLCRILGYMAGDGTCLTHREVGFVANVTDHEVLGDFKRIIGENFPRCEIRERSRFNAQQLSVVEVNSEGHGKPHGNSFREFLREVGMNGQSSFTKRVPSAVFLSGAEGAANFILGYLQTDGTVKRSRGKSWSICFSSVSREMLVDVQSLLSRIEVPALIDLKPANRTAFNAAPLWTLRIPALREILFRFSRAVPLLFRKMRLLETAFEEDQVENVTGPSVYGLPKFVSKMVARKSKESGLHWSERWYFEGKRMRRQTAVEWADKLGDAEIRKWADSDLVWDQVVGVEPVGEVETFDLRVARTHTFLANGIVSHNSGRIEEDADCVIGLYREAYYLAKRSEDDPEKEIARTEKLAQHAHDLEAIVLKNRHGADGATKLWIHPGTASVRDREWRT